MELNTKRRNLPALPASPLFEGMRKVYISLKSPVTIMAKGMIS
jgi:hypothetical protein